MNILEMILSGQQPSVPVPHEFGPSHVGHGEYQCRWCLGTNRELAVVSPNHCALRALRDPKYNGAGTT